MESNTEYTGSHVVLLPANYLDSIDAAVELNEEAIDAVAANLDDVQGVTLRPAQRLMRSGLAALAIWLAPAGWMTCL